MSSLAALAATLDALDLDKNNNHVLKEVSYGLTYNESLGFRDAADFHISQPYVSWPANISAAPTEFESPLAVAFKDVIEEGLTASGKDGKLFIDIASLAGGWPGFFLNTHTGGVRSGENLAEAFGRMLRGLPENVTPIIRCLLGMRGKGDRETPWKDQLQQEFKKLFWPNGTCILPPKAEVYVGFYSPSFDSSLDPQAIEDSASSLNKLVQVARDMISNIRDSSLLLPAAIKSVINDSLKKIAKEEVLKQLAQRTIQSISWNHAKILAVDGKTAMTGGGIFLWDYQDGHSRISDLQAKVKGEAAISTHSNCDYFWKYLNSDHKTDADSFRIHASATTNGVPNWDTKEADLFNRKPTITSATSTATKSVLIVTKLGDWHGEMNKLEFPVQIVDAIRDVILNVTYNALMAKITWFGSTLVFEPYVLNAVSDKNILRSFQAADIAPTSWASRIVRCKAIASAKETVIIDAESIACFLHLREGDWKTKDQPIIDLVNKSIGIDDVNKWDGVIWPYGKPQGLQQSVVRTVRGQYGYGTVQTQYGTDGTVEISLRYGR